MTLLPHFNFETPDASSAVAVNRQTVMKSQSRCEMISPHFERHAKSESRPDDIPKPVASPVMMMMMF